VTREAVHLLTHTAEPLPSAVADRLYGCTEFVFHLAPADLATKSAAPMMSWIEAWLTGPAGAHVCRDGLDPVCIEP
jgi:hypothetical protein